MPDVDYVLPDELWSAERTNSEDRRALMSFLLNFHKLLAFNKLSGLRSAEKEL